jgi:hypothetical protein
MLCRQDWVGSLAYVAWYVLAGEPGVELLRSAILAGHAPEGAGKEVHSEDHDGEQAQDLRSGDEEVGCANDQLLSRLFVRISGCVTTFSSPHLEEVAPQEYDRVVPNEAAIEGKEQGQRGCLIRRECFDFRLGI